MIRLRRWRWPLASLQARFLAGTVLVLVAVMAAVVTVVEERQRATVVEEVKRRGEVVARSLAAASSGPLLLYNFTALEQNVVRVAADPDVIYAIVLDAEGRVAAHSEAPATVGSALPGAVDTAAAGADTLLVQKVATPTGPGALDFAMPIVVEGQRWGVARIGLSRARLEAQIAATRWELVLITLGILVLGGLVAALVARRIARPVRRLAAGAEAISRGDLEHRIEGLGTDEIGQLGLAFNHMTGRLREQRAALETANEALRQRLQDLADLKSYTDSILGSLTVGLVTLDLDGRVATLNPAAEWLTGLFAPEARGRFCTEVFVSAPGVAEALMATLASRTGVADLALTLRRPNGTAVPVELSTTPLRGPDGKELGVLGVFRDVAQVRELEEQVRRADRLAALGTLAAGLAHEIKNPLSSLRTFTRLMPRRADDPHFRETYERVVSRELDRINGIVEGLLELARPARPRLERVQVPQLLERTVELYQHRVETAGIAVVREYARDCPVIQADAEQLYQAFVNLVTNALDAMSSGGCLTLRARAREAAPRPGVVRRGPAPRWLEVEVEDTGAGIAPTEAAHVFNPFFTTKPDGTGLGLALTHKIVEDHGGAITFRSAPGRGTTFRVLLPPTAGAAAGGADV